MSKAKDYNSINWSDYFYIDDDSPSGLSSKDYQVTRKGIPIKEYRKNGPVGTKTYKSNGVPSAWVVNLNTSIYKIHRIIWVLKYGSILNEKVIDHLDGNPFDNSILNLKLKTHKENSQNIRVGTRNSSGVLGVGKATRVLPSGTVSETFTVHWYDISGKSHFRSFSINKYGSDQAKALAIAYRTEQITLLNAAGANYTNRHQGIPST